MRIGCIVGFSSLAAGLPLFAVMVAQSHHQDWQAIRFWIEIILIFLPFLTNAVLAISLQRRGPGSFALMIIPALLLVPCFAGTPESITFALPAGLVGFAGCLTLLAAERFDLDPKSGSSTHHTKLESEAS